MLRRQAFTSLQHGFLRSVENVFIHNSVTPNGVWEMFFFIILTLIFNMIVWHMLCLIVSLADVFLPGRCCLPFGMWQMLLPRGRCYPLILCDWQIILPYILQKMLYNFSLCCNMLYWLMLLPSGRWNSHILLLLFVMADVIAQWQVEKPQLLIYVMAGLIAQWQMEWPLQGGSVL